LATPRAFDVAEKVLSSNFHLFAGRKKYNTERFETSACRLGYGDVTLIGIPAYQLRLLQSVMNAAARSITGLRRSDHITDTLASLHWPRSSERIQYKLATTVFRSLHGLAPWYLSDDLRGLVDMPSRRRLRSASSLQLDVPRTRRPTAGDRAFAAAGPTLWNSLPHDIIDYASQTSFCRKLNTFLFSISFP